MIDPQPIIDALVSHAQLTGRFDRTNTHEPKSPPGNGITCAIWVQNIGPLATMSGLDATTAYLVMNVRIYKNMLAEDQDQIDPDMLAAVIELIGSYSAEFTLAGLVVAIDLLGMGGETLRAEAGYVQIGGQGGPMTRIMTITVPMIIDNAWIQEP